MGIIDEMTIPPDDALKPFNSLHDQRLRRPYTQIALAAKVGCSRKTISNIENEVYEPSVYLAISIARVLGVRVEDIFHLQTSD